MVDGSVNAAANFPGYGSGGRRRVRNVLVVHGRPRKLRAHRAGPCSRCCQRTNDIQRCRMFVLPCRAGSTRSFKARRRSCNPLAVRDFLCAEYLARSGRRYRQVDRSRVHSRCNTRSFARRISLLSGVSLHVLSARENRRYRRPVRLFEDACARIRQGVRSRCAVSFQYPPQYRDLEIAVHGP